MHLLLATRFAIITLAVLSICNLGSHAEEQKPPPVCTEDAMIVFDASGSMSGDGWGYGSESANTVSRGKQLHAEAEQLTIHIIGIRVKGLSAWTGEQSILETKCLAEQNNGLYIPVETEDDLITAFEKTLGCPVLSQGALH